MFAKLVLKSFGKSPSKGHFVKVTTPRAQTVLLFLALKNECFCLKRTFNPQNLRARSWHKGRLKASIYLLAISMYEVAECQIIAEHQKSKDAEKRRQGNDEAGPSRNLGWNESVPEDDDTNDECIDLSSGSSDEETEQTQGKQKGVRETNENGETPLRESTLFRLWEPEDTIRKTSQEENPKGRISGNLKAEALYHDCPNCNKRVPVSELNSHLDSCLEMDLIVID